MQVNQKDKTLINNNTTNNNISLNDISGSRMTVIEVETGDIAAQFDELNGSLVADVAITNNGFSIVAYDDYIGYYNNAGKLIRKINKWGVKNISVNPVDNKTLAIGSIDGKIELWDLENGNLLRVIADESPAKSNILEFSRDGSRLMSGSTYASKSKIRIWDPTNGTRIGPEHSYEPRINPQISFNGTKIVYVLDNSSTEEDIISVVDVGTGQRIIPDIRNSFPNRVMALAFDPNEKEIIFCRYGYSSLGCTSVSLNQADMLRYSLDTGWQVGRVFEGHLLNGYLLNLSTSNATNDLLICSDNKSSVILTWERTTARIQKYIKLEPETTAEYTQISPNGKYYLVTTLILTSGFNYESSNEQEKFCQGNEQNTEQSNSSNLDDVTNEILTSTDYTAPVCAGISKFNILDGVGVGLRGKYQYRYPVPNQPSLFFAVYPSHNNPITISFDNENKKILIHAPLFIDIHHLKEDVQAHRVSRSLANITIQAKPSMVIQGEAAQSLQLDFDGSKLDTGTYINTFIIDPNTVLGTLGSEDALIQLIEKTVNRMIYASASGISMYLSSLVAHAQLPKSWNRSREYELIFKDFIFRNVVVKTDNRTQDVEYIFLLCTAVSHNFPPHCICKEDTKTITPITRSSINDSRRWLSLAFSQDALNTLAAPHRNSGDRVYKEEGGSLRRSVDNYHKSEIGTLYINDNKSVSAEVSVGGGGSLSARLIDPIFKSTISSLTIGYDLSMSHVKTIWDISFVPNFNGENITSVVLTPTVFLSADNIHYKFSSPFPEPLNAAVSWFVEVFLKILATFVSTLIMQMGHIELMFDVFKNSKDDFTITNAWGTSYKRSSIVVIAEATTCKLD
ncbi:WD40 repeat domain-containing protein [Bacillus thuringiensis]|uniref:WD40 repeat domain-containing protein n=1 Tax=Bacillus thuringiensis TaxID=1428 RepID=UPI000CF9B981|nr:hypothetical protein [Bacillus thuringiensis]PQQ47892.1 hypothetical protein C6A34_11615 [Bacillus thuringiensis]